MHPITFRDADRVYAKDQPEYLPLPAREDDGVVTTCWKLSRWERLVVVVTGRIWFQQMNFGQPLQPQRPSATRPI